MFFSLNDIFHGLVSGIKSIQSDNNEYSTQDVDINEIIRDHTSKGDYDTIDLGLKGINNEGSTSEGEIFYFDEDSKSLKKVSINNTDNVIILK
ncbi:hypothetical protein [Capnocytophaga granulosa]|uniref:hypothetical protein n=1 Tax=Capnocytophaga granulosa TaxID=45242 RepID=UPI003C7704A6